MTDKDTEHCNEKVKGQSTNDCNPHKTDQITINIKMNYSVQVPEQMI